MAKQQSRVSRQHNDHTHQMTLSTPRRDTRLMNIPGDTIQPLGKRTWRFPFHYLRTWFFSLLSLVALPVGIGLILIGIEIDDDLRDDWRQVTAVVTDYDEGEYEYEVPGHGEIDLVYELDTFVDVNDPGVFRLTASICDLVAWVIIPSEEDAEFPIWAGDEKGEVSCVPITRDMGSLYAIIGGILVVLSALRLVRTFHGAGLRRT